MNFIASHNFNPLNYFTIFPFLRTALHITVDINLFLPNQNLVNVMSEFCNDSNSFANL
jgi:hypothetical protein